MRSRSHQEEGEEGLARGQGQAGPVPDLHRGAEAGLEEEDRGAVQGAGGAEDARHHAEDARCDEDLVGRAVPQRPAAPEVPALCMKSEGGREKGKG